mmetsp:Transcript_64177/g.106128  ORF Transcript_64177/g.106128 Transcript_64177/m.106128 type:complete len:125 (+) Transcript_64177:1085-1459(+)
MDRNTLSQRCPAPRSDAPSSVQECQHVPSVATGCAPSDDATLCTSLSSWRPKGRQPSLAASSAASPAITACTTWAGKWVVELLSLAAWASGLGWQLTEAEAPCPWPEEEIRRAEQLDGIPEGPL